MSSSSRRSDDDSDPHHQDHHGEEESALGEYTSEPEFYYTINNTILSPQQKRMQEERDYSQRRSKDLKERQQQAAERAKLIAIQKHLATLASIDFDSGRSEKIAAEVERHRRELHMQTVQAQREASERVAATKAQRFDYVVKRTLELKERADTASANHTAAMRMRSSQVAARREEAQARARQKQEAIRSQRFLHRFNQAQLEKSRQRERSEQEYDETGHIKHHVLVAKKMQQQQHESAPLAHLQRAVRVKESAKEMAEFRRGALESQIERENARLAAVARAKTEAIERRRQEAREREERIREQVHETELLKAQRRRAFAQHYDATVEMGVVRREHNAHVVSPRERSVVR